MCFLIMMMCTYKTAASYKKYCRMAKVITIIGSGMMGSALAFPAAENGHEVRLVGSPLDSEIIDACIATNRHPKFDRDFPAGVKYYKVCDWKKAVEGCDFVIGGVSSFGVDWFGEEILANLDPAIPVLSVTKGLINLEDGTLISYPDYWRKNLLAQGIDRHVCAVGGPCTSYELVFHDQTVSIEKKVYVLLNKPKDYVTTSDDPQQRKIVMDLVKDACPERIYPVGRLDRNTTGVLLLTNDGELASKLTHPRFLKKKVYHVYLDKNVTAHDMRQIAEGIELEDGTIRADAIEYASPTDKKQVGIEIHSGKNRIVRRIFESLGYKVTKLDRVQFAGLTKKSLRRGDWRFLTEKEVDMLRMGAFE
mgnify:CR=1 FL=1